MVKKEKIYQVNIISQKPVFTNSLKIKRELEKNAKKVIEGMAWKVYWDEPEIAIKEK
jgi:hypothetical protein